MRKVVRCRHETVTNVDGSETFVWDQRLDCKFYFFSLSQNATASHSETAQHGTASRSATTRGSLCAFQFFRWRQRSLRDLIPNWVHPNRPTLSHLQRPNAPR
jgi:hypothetical protein